MFELRSILETEAVPLAAPRITEDDLTILRQAIDRMTGDERQTERNIEPDIAFHSQIAKATGNEYTSTFIAQKVRKSIHLVRRVGSPETVTVPTVAENITVYQVLVTKDPRTPSSPCRRISQGQPRAPQPFLIHPKNPRIDRCIQAK